jgi:hypothetical protein
MGLQGGKVATAVGKTLFRNPEIGKLLLCVQVNSF